jgi:hypothetical protein
MSSDPLPSAVEEPSPLGRYAPDPSGAPLVTVQLLNLPVHLLAAAREHHDDLLREFRLMSLAGQVGAADPPGRLLELTHILGEQYATAAARRDDEVDLAMERGEDAIDMVSEVPATAAQAARALGALIDEADAFAAQELLITLSRPPLVKRFSDWYLQQVVDQVAGAPPVPWEGPMRLQAVG